MKKEFIFYPKIFSTIQQYSLSQFSRDVIAGFIVGVVALPLAIAFGIASGVTPEQGLITAVVAGCIISLFGGSRVQIGGPTGAFIVIVYGIIQSHGLQGLLLATIMAGIILIIMGITRMGNLIKFVPTPVVVGFTSGIALTIFSSQVRDFMGLRMESIPAHFIEKWSAYANAWHTLNWYALGTSLLTIIIIVGMARFYPKLPGAFFALIVTTVVAYLCELPIETIGSRFGNVSVSIAAFHLPEVHFSALRPLIVPAFTIAILAAIESLLSALVADGMIGGKHRSNTELIAQGIANIITPFFGGIPATGAIARTATNVRNGGRTPVAGICHALSLLIIVVFAGSLAEWIPMATLAGILVIVAYNMSEWREFRSLLKSPKSDVSVLLVTFVITVLFDLSIAVQIGMVLSAFLFMHRMAQVSDIQRLSEDVVGETDADSYYVRSDALNQYRIPHGIEIFEAHGAFFFGAADKFEEILRQSAIQAQCIILRMNNIYILDATGLKSLARIAKEVQKNKTSFVLAEVHEKCANQLIQSDTFHAIGKDNIFSSLRDAIDNCEHRIIAPLKHETA